MTERKVSLCVDKAAAMLAAVLATSLLMWGHLAGVQEIQNWGLGVSAGAATLWVRCFMLSLQTWVREAYELGHEDAVRSMRRARG